jgi:NTP pyrophosphatase (non-canonical NTP hydrolase)
VVVVMSDLVTTLDEYQTAAGRTAPQGLMDEKQIAVFALGIAGEAGEVAELIKKYVGHGHPMDRDKLCKELGDVLWYVSALARSLGIPLSEVAQVNVAKLMKRYPEGFSSEASRNRIDG